MSEPIKVGDWVVVGEGKSINTSLNRFDRLANDLREISERWNKRLVLGQFSFADEYVKGRLKLALDFVVGDDGRVICIIGHHDPKANETVRADLSIELHAFQDKDSKQQPVLINIVELVKKADRIIKSTVRLHFVEHRSADQFADAGAHGSLCYSIIKGCFHTIPVVCDGEMNISNLRRLVETSNDLHPGMIQRGAQVVNDVPEREVDVRRDIVSRFKTYMLTSGGIFLSHDTVLAGRGESGDHGFKLEDVSIGPFDL